MAAGLTGKMRRLERLALGAWIYGFLAFVAVRRVDADYGWHYRSGEYILAHGIPAHDIFTYTASDFAWVNHEWLNDAVMFAVARYGGYFWLGLLYATMWAVAVWLVGGRRLSWMGAGLALGAMVQYAGIRGVAWTVLGLALVLRIIGSGPARYWWLAPLCMVWANVHAGFAIGLVMVGLAAAVRRDGRLAAWGAAGAAATLFNPYGWGVYVELWRTMSDRKLGGLIMEWAPLAVGYQTMPYVVVLAAVLIFWRRRSFEWLRSAGLLAAALWSNRHVPLMVVGSLGLVEARLADGWRLAGRPRWLMVAAGLVVGVVFPLVLLGPYAAPNRGSWLPRPAQVIATLRERPCEGRVFNDYNYGGHLIQALPGVPVYIDGRMPSWQGPRGRYLDVYARVLKEGDFAREEFERYGVQCVVVSELNRELIDYLGSQPEWRLAVRSQRAELWRRD